VRPSKFEQPQPLMVVLVR
jgi:hypothetical protein